MLIRVEIENPSLATKPAVRLATIRLGAVPCHVHVLLDMSDSVYCKPQYLASVSSLLGNLVANLKPGDRLVVWRFGDGKPCFDKTCPSEENGLFSAPPVSSDWATDRGTWLRPTVMALKKRLKKQDIWQKQKIILVSDGEIWDADETPHPGVPAINLSLLHPDGISPKELWKDIGASWQPLTAFAPGPFLSPSGSTNARIRLDDPGKQGHVYEVTSSFTQIRRVTGTKIKLTATLPGRLVLCEVGCPDNMEYWLDPPRGSGLASIRASVEKVNGNINLGRDVKRELEWHYPLWNLPLLEAAANKNRSACIVCPAEGSEHNVGTLLDSPRFPARCPQCDHLLVVKGIVPGDFVDDQEVYFFPLKIRGGRKLPTDSPDREQIRNNSGISEPRCYDVVKRNGEEYLCVRFLNR